MILVIEEKELKHYFIRTAQEMGWAGIADNSTGNVFRNSASIMKDWFMKPNTKLNWWDEMPAVMSCPECGNKALRRVRGLASFSMERVFRIWNASTVFLVRPISLTTSPWESLKNFGAARRQNHRTRAIAHEREVLL